MLQSLQTVDKVPDSRPGFSIRKVIHITVDFFVFINKKLSVVNKIIQGNHLRAWYNVINRRYCL